MKVSLPQDFQAEDAPSVVDEARPVLELPADALIHVENVTQTARGTRIDFSYTTEVGLDKDCPDDVAGVQVDVSSHGDLKFNAQGALVEHDVEPTDPNQLRAISDHLSKLVANGQVYIAQPGEQVDLEALRAQGKNWYMEQDENGTKYLRRAWIS